MELSDVITRVQREFGDEASIQIEPDDILRWASDAVLRIAYQAETNIVTQPTISSVIGQVSYDLDTRFLKAISVTYDGAILKKTTQSELDTISPGRTKAPIPTGTPYLYWIKGKKLFLHHAPGEAGKNIVVEYFARPSPILDSDSDIDLPVEYHPEIVTYCLARARALDGDFREAQNLTAQFEAKVAGYQAEASWPHADEYPSIRSAPDDW